MQTSDIDPIPDLTQCLRPGQDARAIPPECYVSETVTDAEVGRLFRGSWICVGRSDLVANPGDVVPLDIAEQAILLTRGTDGTLRAFANSCRHRGARLVDGPGQCKGLRCPFHSWFYALDGRLMSAPGLSGTPGFEAQDHALHAYAAQERHGFIFLCLNGQSGSLDEHLADFGALHAPWPLHRLVNARRLETQVNCNWKAFLEVFNEYYHLPFVHADTLDSVYAMPDPADDVTGYYATQFGATEGTGGLLEDDQHNALPAMPDLRDQALRGARYTWIFPNMAFAANMDAMWMYEAYPLGPDRCHVVQTICVPPEAMAMADYDTRIASYFARLDAALAEDIPALENQHRGLASPDARAGPFHPELEPNVAAFARWYAAVTPHFPKGRGNSSATSGHGGVAPLPPENGQNV